VDEARFREAEARMWASVGANPSERRIHLQRTGVDVRVQEVGEGPPVVFVHGVSNAGTSWASLVARLPGYRCVLLDRPGCGLSDKLPERFDDVGRFDTFADALVVDVLDALAHDRAAVVTTSYGGYMGLRSAAAHPDRVDRLIEIGWTIGAPILETPLVMRIGSARVLGRLMTAMPVSERAVRMIFKQIGLRDALASGRVSQEMLDWFQALLRDTSTLRNELDASPPIMTPLRGINDSILLSPELLGSIRVPVHFLWGESDPMGGAATARRFAALVPGAELELMPGGHAVWIDDPGRAAASTLRFLASARTA
jgi:pimeloyl-ACP methyl ester carboxylesterase